jgi:uncharacterized protein YciI
MWYLVVSRALNSSEEHAARIQPHIDWLEAHHRAGRVLASGPTADLRCGIFIVLGASRAEVEALVAADPFHVHGDRVAEIYEWNVLRAMRLAGPSVAEIEALAAPPST